MPAARRSPGLLSNGAGAPLARLAGRFRLTPSMVGTALSRVGPAFTVRPCGGRGASPASPSAFWGGPSTLTFLVGHGWQASQGYPEIYRCWRGGEATSARSPRAASIVSCCPCVRADSRTFAPTPANRGVSNGEVGGQYAFAAYPDTRSRSPRSRGARSFPAPTRAGADILRLRARGVGGSAPAWGHVNGLVRSLLGAAIFLKAIKLTAP